MAEPRLAIKQVKVRVLGLPSEESRDRREEGRTILKCGERMWWPRDFQ